MHPSSVQQAHLSIKVKCNAVSIQSFKHIKRPRGIHTVVLLVPYNLPALGHCEWACACETCRTAATLTLLPAVSRAYFFVGLIQGQRNSHVIDPLTDLTCVSACCLISLTLSIHDKRQRTLELTGPLGHVMPIPDADALQPFVSQSLTHTTPSHVVKLSRPCVVSEHCESVLSAILATRHLTHLPAHG